MRPIHAMGCLLISLSLLGVAAGEEPGEGSLEPAEALVETQGQAKPVIFADAPYDAPDGSLRWRVRAVLVVDQLSQPEAEAIGLEPKPAKEPPHDLVWPTRYVVIRQTRMSDAQYHNAGLIDAMKTELRGHITREVRAKFAAAGYALRFEEPKIGL